MFENIHRGDGGATEKREKPKKYFNWYVFPITSDLRQPDPITIEENKEPILDKAQAITEARAALVRISSGKAKHRKSLIIALVKEFQVTSDQAKKQSRHIWSAPSSFPEGEEVIEEWEDE